MQAPKSQSESVRVEEELRSTNARLETTLTERTKLIRLLQEVAMVANQAATIDEALETTIETICTRTPLPCSDTLPLIGHIYRKLTTAITRRVSYWKIPESHARFRAASDALEFAPGIGLIGRVIVSRQLEWVADLGQDATDPRAETAQALSIKSAFAFPIVAGQDMVAVMEVFSPEPFELDATLTEVMSHIGIELGRIIERKQAEEKLRQSELLSAIGLTASKLAHDISNPLNGMYTAAQFLEQIFRSREAPVDDVVMSTLQDLKKEVDRARLWLQEFRALSKPMKFEFEVADVGAIARDIAGQERQRWTERGITLALEFAPDLPRLNLDREKIRQALLNLCQNAVEAMPRGGKLTLRGYKGGNDLLLEVEDTGVGVREGTNVFEVFVSSKRGGTGLGLPIVQQIVSGHQGSVSYVTRPDQGSTFRVSLPIGDDTTA